MKTETKAARREKEKRAQRIQEKKRRQRSKRYTKIFYAFYGLTIIVLFALLFKAADYVNGYVRAFEASQPKYAAAAAAQPFFERNYAVLAQCEDPDIFKNETIEQYTTYMDRLLGGRFLSYHEVYSDDKDVKRYVIEADDEKIGSFTLRHTSDDSYGFEQLTMGEMDTVGLNKRTYTVDAPADSTVYVNGKALTAEDVVESGIPEFTSTVSVSLPAGSVVPTRCKYEFSRYFDVAVKVVDPYGEENEVSVAGPNYTAAYNYDDSRMAAELDERVIQVVRRLSCCLSKDYPLYNLSKDMVKDCKAYKYLEAFDFKWVMDHRSYDFENMVIDHYVRYSEDCFSVEARYDYKIIYYTVKPEIYPTHYRLYFLREGDTWKLFDFTLV